MRRSVLVASGGALVLAAVVAGGAVLATLDDRVQTARSPSSTVALAPTSAPTSAATTGIPTSATSRTGPTTTSSLPTTEPPTPVLRSFTIAATGDLLVHTSVAQQASTDAGGSGYDFTPMLAEVAPLLSTADLAICHVETPLSADDSDVSGYPVFSAPRELAAAIATAGYDTCSTASNHSLDRGLAGVTTTLDALDEAGIGHAGTARDADERTTASIRDVRGVRVAHLAYTYGLNGFPLPAGAPWAVGLLDPTTVLADAAAARGAGAEFVVVSLQWGNEYHQAPTRDQQAIAQTLLSSPDVDLIIGHHVHVVQPLARVGDEVVAYGLGNFLSNQSPDAGLLPSTQDGVILHLRIDETAPGTFRVMDATFTPTFVDRDHGYVIRPVDAHSNPDSYRRTVDAMQAIDPAGVRPDR